MTNDFDWIKEYKDWLVGNFHCEKLSSGWTAIATPIMDRHNDGITVYANNNNGNITLSDDGYIIGDLLADGMSFKGKNRKILLENLLLSYGAKNEDNVITMKTTEEHYAMSFHMFMQALLAINDMFFLNSPNVKTIFLEDVSDYLEENNIIYTSNFLARGSTGIEFKFDFQIAGRTSEILISSFNSINRQNLSSFLFDWLDIKEERIRQAKKDVSGLAIINDIEKPVDQQFLNALSAKGTEYILFSQRNTADSIGKLNAA